MSPAIITLIAWSPFLLLALIFGLTFSFKGYKRGSALAGISIGITVISCILSIIIARLIATGIAGIFAPMLSSFLQSAGLKGGSDEIAKLATSIAAAFASLIIYVPVFIILASVLKPVSAFLFKKIIPKPKHAVNKAFGLSISIVDALLLAILVTLPLYGTLALADDFIDTFSYKNDDEVKEYVSAATDPFIVDVASVPPFSTAYDTLMSCKIGNATVSISGTVREVAVVLRHAKVLSDLKDGNFSNKDVLTLLNSAESLLTDNKFATDFACEYLNDNLPSVKVPGIGKIKLGEYYPSLSDSKQLRKDIPALFDLTETMVKSGMLEALTSKDKDMSKIDVDVVTEAFGDTLNHSTALATFKSKLLNTLVDTLSKDIINEGKDKDGAVKALCDAIASIPTEPLNDADAKKEGESFYLIVSGAVTSTNKKSNAKGLGMLLEGLARHPKVGVDKVMDAAGTILGDAGMNLSNSLLDKMELNLVQSVNKPIALHSFGNYCQTAFKAADAISNLAGITGGIGGSGNESSGGNDDASKEEAKEQAKESLKDLIVADKESLEAVKDTVSTDLMEDLGIEKEYAETFKDVIDVTFDAIIDEECTEEEAEKEAKALSGILGAVTELTSDPDSAEEKINEQANEIIEQCLDSKVVTNMVEKLTQDGESDPLGIFEELTPEAKETVENTINNYIANAETEEERAALEAYKLFVGLIN